MPTFYAPGRILITGASGYLGEHLSRRLAAAGSSVVGTKRASAVDLPGVAVETLDLRDAGATLALIRRVAPTAVVHCAALTDVATCERDPAAAHADIVSATENLARALAEAAPRARFVHVSTDLVFDGEAAPYREDAAARPLAVYGRAKLAAEAVAAQLPSSAIVRTALLYGPPATNRGTFLKWMLDTLRAGKELALFADEVRTPLAVDDACIALAALIGTHADARGILHCGGSERLSRLAMGELAARAFALDASRIRPLRLADSTFGAPRARDVSLDSTKLWSLLAATPRPFAEALASIAAHAADAG